MVGGFFSSWPLFELSSSCSICFIHLKGLHLLHLIICIQIDKYVFEQLNTKADAGLEIIITLQFCKCKLHATYDRLQNSRTFCPNVAAISVAKDPDILMSLVISKNIMDLY